MFPLAIIFLLLGLLTLVLGRLGGRAGHHPHCRVCGFNLHALPFEHARCPECGADIRADDAITIGSRRAIYPVIMTSLVLLLAGSFMLALGVLAWWPGFDGSAYKPFRFLEANINSPDEGLRARTGRELLRRLHANALSTEQANDLTDLILKYQADPALIWDMQWGDVVQAAHVTHHLAPDRWQRFLEQAPQITARVRPRVRMDDPIPLALTCRLRAGSEYTAIGGDTITPALIVSLGAWSAPLRVRSVALDSIPTPIEWTTLWIPGGQTAWPADNTPNAGPQTLNLAITMTLADGGATVSTSKNLSLPFELLPRTQSSVKLQSSPALKADFDTAARLRLAGDGARTVSFRLIPAIRWALFWIADPTIPTAYYIILRQNSHDWPLARLMVRPNDAAIVPLTFTASGLNDGPAAGPAEIVCIPDPALAVGTVDILEVYGMEMRWPCTLQLPIKNSP